MKYLVFICALVTMCVGFTVKTYADAGDLGFFGGVTAGRPLKSTIQNLIAQSGKTTNGNNKNSLNTKYNEEVFLNGKPSLFTGTMTIASSQGIKPGTNVGAYKITYTVAPNAQSPKDPSINRSISFNVNYRVQNNQVIKDYSIQSWTETIIAGGTTYTLDSTQSDFTVSTIEDTEGGVTFYKGTISTNLVYSGQTAQSGNAGAAASAAPATTSTITSNGSIYGYTCPWSSSEGGVIDSTLDTGDWQMSYQTRPAVTVNKTLQYSSNQPKPIGFSGDYLEKINYQAGLRYNIFTKPNQLFNIPNQGQTEIKTLSTFEHLVSPDLKFLKSNPAENDISKLFAMNLISGPPKSFVPSTSMPRGQFVMMMVKALNLTLPKPSKNGTLLLFPDVDPKRQEFPYVVSAFNAGIISGSNAGLFDIDKPITREMAVNILMRSIGLDTLGEDPTVQTSFADDKSISTWAKRSISAAQKIDLIAPDANGNFNPQKVISKAEAAALMNHFIDYMRTGITSDYTEKLVDFAN